MRRRWLAAMGVGLIVVALYIAAVGALGSTGRMRGPPEYEYGFVSDDAWGYGVAVFVVAAAGAWMIFASGGRGDRPR